MSLVLPLTISIEPYVIKMLDILVWSLCVIGGVVMILMGNFWGLALVIAGYLGVLGTLITTLYYAPEISPEVLQEPLRKGLIQQVERVEHKEDQQEHKESLA